ncbi:MAG: hypothetical protein RJA42_627, partial [Bacteroidota bacterium]
MKKLLTFLTCFLVLGFSVTAQKPMTHEIMIKLKKVGAKLTNSKGGEDNYQWSAASDKIYFIAKRDGDDAPQLYVLPLAGGEAQRLTTLSTGVNVVKFSPDG